MRFYNIWGDSPQVEDKKTARHRALMKAPKLPLPAHKESYHPPDEYLLNEEELKDIEELSEELKPHFLPHKYVPFVVYFISLLKAPSTFFN